MAKEQGGDRVVRSTTLRILMAVGVAVTVVSFVADVFLEHHGAFGFDGWFGFHAAFGFVSGLAIVGISKALSVVLKRPASYYEKRR